MDYTAEIQCKLHDYYGGLKKGEGLTWLNDALNHLDHAGLGQLVETFIRWMGYFGSDAGSLLEIQTAQAAIAAYPDAKLSYARKDGTAREPRDITMDLPQLRADFQCKAILNFYNEMFTTELALWVSQTYSGVDPGRIIHFRANTAADEQTFVEFRPWFAGHWHALPLEEEQEWTDSRGKGRVWITLYPAIGPGLCVGVTQSPTQRLGFLQQQDTPHIRRKVLNRMSEARKTFGFPPSARQFNFVVIDAPSLAIMLGEEPLFDAIYGDDCTEHCIRVDGTSVMRDVRKKNGIFHRDEVNYCSAVILGKLSIDGTHESVLYPHPRYFQEVSDAWVGRGGFRLPRQG